MSRVTSVQLAGVQASTGHVFSSHTFSRQTGAGVVVWVSEERLAEMVELRFLSRILSLKVE